MEREEVSMADFPKYTMWYDQAIPTVSTTTTHDEKPHRPLGNWCWKTDSVRVDNGCLHCDWSMKLGPSWFCFYPKKAGITDSEQDIDATMGRGTCHDKNGFDPSLGFECTVCGTMVDEYMTTPMDYGHQEQFRYCPGCGARVVRL